MAHSNTVLSQLLKMIPRHEFEKLANTVDGKVRSTALSRWSQFVALAVGQLSGRQSLRDIESCLSTQRHLQYHLGTQAVSKSALGRANEQRDAMFYLRLFEMLYQRCTHCAPRHGFRFKSKLFSLDGSLLDASMKLFPWADYNRKKAAFKLHVGLDHDGLIPCFARVTEGRVSENEEARAFNAPRGSVVVFDKGYNNYRWHKALTDKGIYWVTRIRGNAKYRVLERADCTANPAITSDQIIKYSSKQRDGDKLYPIRRIGYRDPETGRHYMFITNHFTWSAQTIADIYKQRWQVELFFKWIKQNLKIKSFLGNSKNAVLSQVLAALCVYLIIAFMKFQSKLTQSMQQITRLLHTNLFSKRDFIGLFEKIKPDKHPPPQLSLALARR
ncbi:MAG: IS4 family transposase [Gammaproteobacteria bacterium]